MREPLSQDDYFDLDIKMSAAPHQAQRELAEQRSRPDDVQTYAFMGDLSRDRRDLPRALGWLNRGLDHLERIGSAESQTLMLCVTRWHVRKAQGHEPDAYDQRAISALERSSPS